MQMSPIQRGLEDRHPYVRRTAVMGVLKVYNFDEAAVQNAGEHSRPLQFEQRLICGVCFALSLRLTWSKNWQYKILWNECVCRHAR